LSSPKSIPIFKKEKSLPLLKRVELSKGLKRYKRKKTIISLIINIDYPILSNPSFKTNLKVKTFLIISLNCKIIHLKRKNSDYVILISFYIIPN
jgi:hypothetical protein